MNALIIYDSVFGNTEKIARAIGKGFEEHGNVQVVKVGDVTYNQLEGIDYLVIGSPTRKFRPTPKISGFLKSIPKNGLSNVKVAVFDTRFTEQEIERIRILAFFVRIFGYAAKSMTKLVLKKGGEPVVPSKGFYLRETEGPLLENELQRAGNWVSEIISK